ncbi:hypothetical protein OEA41_004483 [Lepraria neglecta]|uniref:Uncharacterized protein n=1 Tax=Lepraria neglecta TaxID=209136 RepID=A0AAD9Z143_9LECA|nr:hypothetical protein OEA41_004483 [Lepraria neglecta]
MERCANPKSQLEIDEWILDYLVFMAIKYVLEDYKSPESPVENANARGKAGLSLQLVDSFLKMFRTMHPGYDGNLELQFRLRLLKFAVMFTKRVTPTETSPSTPALQKLRDQRQNQASAFRSSDQSLSSLDLPDLTAYLAPPDHARIKREQSSRNTTPYDFPSITPAPFTPSISLLDTLPFFMSLSAAQNSMNQTTITDVWMRLAAGYMAQAVAEQYPIYDSERHEVLPEAFAWGFDAECGAEEGSDEWQINAMFWGEDEVVPGWEEIRDEHMQALIPPAGTDLQVHLRTLTETDLSIAKFEQRVLDFLEGLLLGHPMPMLAQVESGKVDGLSRRDARALQEAIGMA